MIEARLRVVREREMAQTTLQLQLNRLNLLHQITRATGERQDLRSIFQAVIRSLEDDLPVDFGLVCLYDAGQNALVVAGVGARSGALARELSMAEQMRITIDQDGLSRCLRGELVHEPDIAGSGSPFAQHLAGARLHDVVMAPLVAESSVFGALIVARTSADSFSVSECEFLRQLSEHVALAAHQAQLHAALQQAYDELRQSQEAVMQQERLRALGQMASGVAHDINNAIAPIALYTESLLESEPGLTERAREYLRVIRRAIEDVSETVIRMRQFYRPRERQMELVRIDLNAIVQQVVELTRVRWRDLPQERGVVIEVRTDLRQRIPPILGTESEIRDALTNLIFNAVDAMPGGGSLTVRTQLSADARPGAATVHLEVSDTGVGMDEETRRRCLEPFFTTKGERGTGLGLAMVYGMVQRHGADLAIDSAPGRGTTVRISFAAVEPAVSEAGPATTAPESPQRALSVLIVDDDRMVLESLRAALEGDGHRVVGADGGRAGIDAFAAAQREGDHFDVVITDLGMPHVDGRQVAAAIKAASSATPVILLTGWGQRLADQGEMPAHVDRILSKPPKLRALRAALSQITDVPPPGPGAARRS